MYLTQVQSMSNQCSCAEMGTAAAARQAAIAEKKKDK